MRQEIKTEVVSNSDEQRSRVIDPIHEAFENAISVDLPPENCVEQVTTIEVTEDGAARELVRRNGHKIRYDNNLGAWWIWEGTVWRKDATGRIRETLKRIAREATVGLGTKVLRAVRRAGFISGAERMAMTDSRVSVSADYWDRDPMLLGCPGATIDLRTGKHLTPRPENGITKLCGVNPEKGDCPVWQQFLADATGGDEEVIAFLQMWFGYLLTGQTDEQVLLFVHGPGGNGKSVFLNIMSRVLGDYSATAAMDTFTKSKGDRHPTDLAMLAGARSVSVSETEDNRGWSEARIKQLTGGDEVTARFMRRDFFTFRPSFKLTIVGNHQPVINDVDPALRRRLLILPFTHQPTLCDPNLEKKLWSEAPQILSWAIRGCLERSECGLPRPAAIQSATEQYFEDQDTFSQWLEECCEIDKANSFSTSADLYQSWRRYAEEAGEDAGSRKLLGQKLKRIGLSGGQRRIREKNCKVWVGISLSKCVFQ